MEKKILLKVLKLDKYFKVYEAGGEQKKQTIQKFTEVWGEEMATHFLWKYYDAESLIWAFDSRNLELFIQKF